MWKNSVLMVVQIQQERSRVTLAIAQAKATSKHIANDLLQYRYSGIPEDVWEKLQAEVI